MKKYLMLFMAFVFILSGCSQSDTDNSKTQVSKLEEITSQAKSDQEAFELLVDSFNDNVKTMKCQVIRSREGEEDMITGVINFWKKDDGIWSYRKQLDETTYHEILLTTNHKSSVYCYNFENTESKYGEIPNAKLDSGYFRKDLDNMKVEKSDKDGETMYIVHYTFEGPDETGKNVDLPCVGEYVVNKDGLFTSYTDYQVDSDGKRIEHYDLYKSVYSDYNTDIPLDEEEIVNTMKSIEKKSYQDMKKEWKF